MKPTKTKAQTRDEISRQINDFLNTGGKVERVNPGVSGRDLGQNLALPISMERSDKPNTRTLVNEQIAAIESRRGKNKPHPLKPRPKKPEKILIVDDFGEPVRWVWSDDT